MANVKAHWLDGWNLTGQSTPDGMPLRVFLRRGSDAVVVDLVAGVAYPPMRVDRLSPDWFPVDDAYSEDVWGGLRTIASALEAPGGDLAPGNETLLSRPVATVASRQEERTHAATLQRETVEAIDASETSPTIESLVGRLRQNQGSIHLVVHWSSSTAQSQTLRHLAKWHRSSHNAATAARTASRPRRPLLGPDDRITFFVGHDASHDELRAFSRWGSQVKRLEAALRHFGAQDPLGRSVPPPPEMEFVSVAQTNRQRKLLQHGKVDIVFVSGWTRPDALPRDSWTLRATSVIFEARGPYSIENVASAGKVGRPLAAFLSDAGSVNLWRLFSKHPKLNDIIRCARRVFTEVRSEGIEAALLASGSLLQAAVVGGMDSSNREILWQELESDLELNGVLDGDLGKALRS